MQLSIFAFNISYKKNKKQYSIINLQNLFIMKKHSRFFRLFIVIFLTTCSYGAFATITPYLPPLQSFGGTSADISTISLSAGDYTLEVQGTSGTLITVAGGLYSYTPITSGNVRFSQKKGKVYVYEGSVYMATLTPDLTKVSYPDIFGATNSSSLFTGIYDLKNLLQNPGFETIPNTPWKCYDYLAANIAITAIGASGTSIRIGSQVTEINAILFHKTARYLTQSIPAGTIKSNTFYKVAFKYKTNSAGSSQDGAVFRVDLGTTERGTDIISTPTRTTANNTTITNFIETFSTGTINASNPVWFLLERTANYNASSQKLEWYDNFTLVEGSTVGISGATSATYLAGTAYAPENLVVDYNAGDYYDLTSYITNPSFESGLTGWTNSGFVTQSNTPGQTWVKDGNLYAERYVSSGSNLPASSINQNITDLPNGRYRLALSAHAIQQSNLALVATGGFAVAGASNTPVNVGGTYTVDNVPVIANSLNIGYKLEAPITCNWTGFDNFKLYYFGPITDPVLSAPQTTAAFTTTTNTAAIDLTGSNIATDISITVPSSQITLTGTNVTGTSPNYTIALANANMLNTITATWDKTANVSGNISFTSGTASKVIAVTSSDVETVALSGITLSTGGLNPAFAVGTTTYSVKTPADVASVVVTAITTPSVATVTNNGTTISTSSSSVVLTGNSYNGANHTADYTVNYTGNYTFTDWAANGTTEGALSVPTVYGWSANPTLTWVTANSTQSGTVRYMDMVDGTNPAIAGITYMYNSINYTGRIMFVRWDGSASRVYSYPVYLEGCKSYNFTSKVAWNSVAAAGTLTFKINASKDNTGTNYATGTAVTATAGAMVDGNMNFTVPTSGVYYLTYTASNAALYAIADLSITENLTQSLTVAQTPLVFDAANLTKTFSVSGNALTSNVTLTAPTGISLDKTTITPAEAQCGVIVSALFDNTTSIVNGIINATDGTLTYDINVNSVVAATNSACVATPYPARTNLVVDPGFNSLSNYQGWGAKTLVIGSAAYCGNQSAKITGRCGGSIDYNLTGIIQGGKTYRVRAMVSTNGTGEAKIGISGATAVNVIQPISTNAGEWLPVDFTFTAQAVITSANMYFNSCEAQTATEGFIDNWEMYEMPTLMATTVESADEVIFTSVGHMVDVTVAADGFTNGFTVSNSKPESFELSTTTLPSIGGVVTVKFIGSASATDNLVITTNNPVSPAPGMNRIGAAGTSITIPMRTFIVWTGINNLKLNDMNAYLVDGKIVASFNLAKQMEVNINVYSANGVQYSNCKSTFNAGNNQFTLDNQLPSGVYLIKMTFDGKSVTRKIVK